MKQEFKINLLFGSMDEINIPIESVYIWAQNKKFCSFAAMA